LRLWKLVFGRTGEDSQAAIFDVRPTPTWSIDVEDTKK
jgi:hypothetical protein